MKTMIDGIVRFHKGVWGAKIWIKAWLAVLMGVLFAAPVYYWAMPEAKVIFGTMTASAVLMMWLTGRYGFSRILGAGHVLLIPLAGYLLSKLCIQCRVGQGDLFLKTALGVILLSLAFDIPDVIRYYRGEREETVKTTG